MAKHGSYKEFQFAWWILILVPVWSIMPFLYYSDHPTNKISGTDLLYISIIFALVGLLFYGMKTHVNASKITIAFGIGLIRKTIDLESVESVESVRNKWYYGWGIRIIPNGWMYNIAGLQAVEIKRKNKNSVLRIGSKHPEVLRKVISDGILVS